MKFDHYIYKNLAIATVFITLTLSGVIILTQSLRFLELVIKSGASGAIFWVLTLLSLPRFFEIIVPISLMAAVVFVYNRMTLDHEIVVLRSAGFAPFKLARPALFFGIAMVLFLWIMTMWAGPASLSQVQKMRQIVKSQYSTLLFQEGVFNSVMDGLTVYIRERKRNGELNGILIHDNRDADKPPVTVTAKRGALINTADGGQQVVVFEGARQDLQPRTGTLNRLNFEKYTIDLPADDGSIRKRWREPDERTFWQLLNPDMSNKRDAASKREFMIEAHRRLVSPLLAIVFVTISLTFLLLGPHRRSGKSKRIITAIALTIVLQGLFLASYNLAVRSDIGLFLMYMIVFAPLSVCAFLLSPKSEDLRQKLLFKIKPPQLSKSHEERV